MHSSIVKILLIRPPEDPPLPTAGSANAAGNAGLGAAWWRKAQRVTGQVSLRVSDAWLVDLHTKMPLP